MMQRLPPPILRILAVMLPLLLACHQAGASSVHDEEHDMDTDASVLSDVCFLAQDQPPLELAALLASRILSASSMGNSDDDGKAKLSAAVRSAGYGFGVVPAETFGERSFEFWVDTSPNADFRACRARKRVTVGVTVDAAGVKYINVLADHILSPSQQLISDLQVQKRLLRGAGFAMRRDGPCEWGGISIALQADLKTVEVSVDDAVARPRVEFDIPLVGALGEALECL